MRKITILAFFAALPAIMAAQTHHNTIEGNVEGLEKGDRIILYTGTLTQTPIATDSTIVKTPGKFTLKTAASDTYAQIAFFKPGQKADINQIETSGLFLEGYDKIKLNGKTSDWRYLKISGGLYSLPQMQEINALTEKALEMQKQGIALLGKTRTEGADKDSVKAWSDKGRALLGKSGEIFDQRKALEKKISADNPDLAYSAEILHYDYDLMKKGMDKYEEAFNALSPRVQKCPAGQVLADFIATQKATAIGAEAPDFSLEDIDGNMLRLSDFRGKYVLLDFWGTWCGPCRQSTPHLVELYSKVKGRNFEMISIATNERSDDYWRKIVSDDKMTWRQLNDAHSPANGKIQQTYGVMGVPSCFFIDPHGMIIAKGHPMSLLKKVEEVITAPK